ncbi:hypothetical protein N9440_00200 [Alphaproteobacteria bacterium]|nr:hypothetical protein [Alphaproteobacteria bacterium]
MNQLLIVLEGTDKRVIKNNANGIVISKTDKLVINEKYTLLQADFRSIDDLIKAKQIINNQIKHIEEIVIINRDIELNMISYQYDYEYIKEIYQTLANIVFFLNALIDNFDKNINFILSFEKSSHYKIHINNFNYSIVKYLEVLKKDLDRSHQINIKKLD